MRVVDLFAGAGGASLGLHRAGLDHVACVERDGDACATLRSATGGGLFGRAHEAWGAASPGVVVQCDVARWIPERADLWWASPPCQPDSTMGKRKRGKDTRDGWPLLWGAVDLANIRGVGPTWLVGENVLGVRARIDALKAEAARRFAWVGVWELNAADFGVAQVRRRVFLVAGPRRAEAPKPTHAGAWQSVRDVLGLVGTLDGGRNSSANPTQERVRTTDEPAQTISTRGNLVFTGADGVRRCLSPEECAVLQGFPARWPFEGHQGARHRQIGNAVCPPVATAIGKAVRDA